MSDLTRPTATLGQVATTRTVSEIHPANQDVQYISGKLAAADLGAGQIVYLTSSDTFALADANNGTAALKNSIGMVMKDAYSGDAVSVAYFGEMGGFAAGGAALTPGAFYYLSDTIGEIATAPSSTTFLPIGVATGTDTMLIFPFMGRLLADLLALALA